METDSATETLVRNCSELQQQLACTYVLREQVALSIRKLRTEIARARLLTLPSLGENSQPVARARACTAVTRPATPAA